MSGDLATIVGTAKEIVNLVNGVVERIGPYISEVKEGQMLYVHYFDFDIPKEELTDNGHKHYFGTVVGAKLEGKGKIIFIVNVRGFGIKELRVTRHKAARIYTKLEDLEKNINYIVSVYEREKSQVHV